MEAKTTNKKREEKVSLAEKLSLKKLNKNQKVQSLIDGTATKHTPANSSKITASSLHGSSIFASTSSLSSAQASSPVPSEEHTESSTKILSSALLKF